MITILRTQQMGGKKTAILSRNPENGLVDFRNRIGGRRNTEDTAYTGQIFNASFGKDDPLQLSFNSIYEEDHAAGKLVRRKDRYDPSSNGFSGVKYVR
jgi:hypothetical protein